MPRGLTPASGMIMTPVQAAWVAGLLEGEGCWTLRKGQHLSVVCNMTDRDVLETLQRITGVGFISSGRTMAAHGRHKQTHSWQVQRTADAVILTEQLLPHLHGRRREKATRLIDTVQEHWSVLRIA